MERAAKRAAELSGLVRVPLAVLLGIALAAAQPPISQPWVLFVCLPPIYWLVVGAGGAWRAAGLGWATGTGFFAAALFWIREPFQVDPGLHGWLAPFASVGMAGGLALFWAAAFGATKALGPSGVRGGAFFACTLTAAEVARSTVLTGFPWALVGYAWVETPVIQTASLWGVHGLGFLTLLAALLPAAPPPRLGRVGATGLAVALVGAGWVYGSVRLSAPTPERSEPVLVRLVQPNMPQHLKWDPEWEAVFYQRHLSLSAAEGSSGRPDVVVWSEAAVPLLLGESPAHQAEMAAAAGAPLVLGIVRYEAVEDGDPLWYNSLAVLGQDGAALGLYDKHHLVPFGEYIPFQRVVRRLGGPTIETLTRGGYSAGQGPHNVRVPEVPPFLPLICYEAIFPAHARAPEGRPDWMVQVTNDAWFGTLSGPFQHYAQNRVRAIEQGLPLARVANTGISAMIDAHGREVARLDLGETGYLDVYLPGALSPTLYAQMGDGPVYSVIVLLFGLTFMNLTGGVSRGVRT